MADEEQGEDRSPEAPRFIVGIGASAGGLEALIQLIKHVRLDHMSFVVVQHLAPQHESALASLLARVAHINVVVASEGARLERNNIYVIPPSSDLAVEGGVLHVLPPPPHGIRLPVDYFFRTLAKDQGARSIGIVLSGTGSDGTFGLRAIKEAGGITFVQEPESAKYDGMPRSAMDSGWADFILRPEAIAERLMSIGGATRPAGPPTLLAQSQESFGRLIQLMRNAFGNDLTYYKPSTIERRIERRMAMHKVDTIDDYLKFVQGNGDELRMLYKDTLISVTNFFRDHETFEALKTKVFPELLGEKAPGSHIRIWAPACASGEEAYSYAIVLLEFLGERAQDYRFQIFGTDLDDTSIQHARRGTYPQNIALDVSPERLQRYFVKKDGEYQISRRIRDMVVFSVQNVTKDAPFSRLDVVSCRNLLIYLQPPMQKKVLRILHYSLQPQGVLVLGTSETVGESSEMFTLLDRKNKIYAKRHVAVNGLDIGLGVQGVEPSPITPPRTGQRPPPNLTAIADRKVLDLYGPPGVVVNDDLDVIHIRGGTGPYLEPMPGPPSFNILRLARPELHLDLRRAIDESRNQNKRVTATCRLSDPERARVRLDVVPIIDPETKRRCTLILFHDEARVVDDAAGSESATSPDNIRTEELERELVVTKEYLQSTIEELESANEELKSSNEELQSANEELQSTNEELETSKEELQAANEELTTVNDELQDRMAELQQTNDDLHNVLTGIGNAVVIVGLDLRIRRYTHTAERLLNLIPADIGRSISHLNNFVGRRVDQLAAEVIERLTPVVQEVEGVDNRWYELNITPYKTLDHSIRGAVIVLVDVDARRRAVELGRNIGEYVEQFMAPVSLPMAVVDRRLRLLWASPLFLSGFGVTKEGALGLPIGRVAGGRWADPELVGLLEGTAANGTRVRDFRHRFDVAGSESSTYKISAARIPALGSESVLVLIAFEAETQTN